MSAIERGSVKKVGGKKRQGAGENCEIQFEIRKGNFAK